MNGTWVVSVDVDGIPWLILMDPESKIGPFPTVRDAEAARVELAAVSVKPVLQ